MKRAGLARISTCGLRTTVQTGKQLIMTSVSQQAPVGLSPWALALALTLVLAGAGCGRQDIRVYSVPKERSTEAPWVVPRGWEATPGDPMRLARFAVRGTNDAAADVSVISFNLNASQADIVNIWREQIKLPPLDSDQVAAQAKKVQLGSASGELFELVSTEPVLDGKSAARVLVVLFKHEESTWIVKMSGTDELVAAEKPTFLTFLNSFHAEDLGPYKAAQAQLAMRQRPERAPTPSAPRPQWTVPTGWSEIPNPQMLLAKFRVTGTDGTSVDVNVSVEAGDGGGLLGNINRWRGQLGLAPANKDELAKLTTNVELPEGSAALVDMSGTNAMNGQPARIIGAVVPRDGQTWFYKLMGHQELAAREREAFVRFFQTAKYPNG